MKILITGGAGFIGSNLIFHLISKYKDYKIYCLDALTYSGNLINLTKVIKNPNFTFIKADLRDAKKINEIFKEYEFNIIINLAAESHVDRSIEDPNIFLETNIIGTANLMNAALKLKDLKLFYQISTDEVYGDLPLDRKDLLFDENSSINPSSPYSTSKASADLLVEAYHRTYGLPIIISRCSNNYGPFQFPEKLIPLMIYRASNDKSLPVYGNGENVRDWLHVKDHAKAIDLIMHKGKIGEIYNIGGHNELSNIEVVRCILKHLNKSEDLISYVSDRKGHDLRYAINPSKLEALGFKPDYDFKSGIKETIDWYINNRKWMDTIINGEYLMYYDKMYNMREK